MQFLAVPEFHDAVVCTILVCALSGIVKLNTSTEAKMVKSKITQIKGLIQPTAAGFADCAEIWNKLDDMWAQISS